MGPESSKAHKTSPPPRQHSWEKKGVPDHHCQRPGCIHEQFRGRVRGPWGPVVWRGKTPGFEWHLCLCFRGQEGSAIWGVPSCSESYLNSGQERVQWEDFLCPDNLALPPCLALNVCSNPMLPWFLCLNVCWCVHVATQLWRLKIILREDLFASPGFCSSVPERFVMPA